MCSCFETPRVTIVNRRHGLHSLSRFFTGRICSRDSKRKEYGQRFAESRGFSPGSPVFSHRESWHGGLGKKTTCKIALAYCGFLKNVNVNVNTKIRQRDWSAKKLNFSLRFARTNSSSGKRLGFRLTHLCWSVFMQKYGPSSSRVNCV